MKQAVAKVLMVSIAMVSMLSYVFAQEPPTDVQKEVAALRQQVAQLQKQLVTPEMQTATRKAEYEKALFQQADFCPKVATFVAVGVVNGQTITMCGATIDRSRKRVLGIF